jgi:hypothetical protein
MIVILTRVVVLGFLAALAFVVVAKLLNGEINTRHLLEQRQPDGTYETSSGRVQLLIFTLLIALKYLYDTAGSGKLPEVPNETLVLLGGSHAVYLSGKTYATFFASTRSQPQEENK